MILVREVYIYIYIYNLGERKEGCWSEMVLPIQEQRKRKKKEQRRKNKGYTF